jgi:hypothetical protein
MAVNPFIEEPGKQMDVALEADPFASAEEMLLAHTTVGRVASSQVGQLTTLLHQVDAG